MKIPKLSKRMWIVLVVVVILILATLPLLGLAHFTTTNSSFCLTCHATGETADIGLQSKVHPDYGTVGCIDCHAQGGGHFVTDGYKTGYMADPSRVSPNCVRCHSNMTTKTDTSGFKFNVDHININHQMHISAGAQCTDCHRNIAHDLNVNPTNRPRMDYCFQCHTSTSTSCTACHPQGPPAGTPHLPPPPSIPDVPTPDMAQVTFEVSCSKCHALYPVSKYNRAQWMATVNAMASKPGSGISDSDKALIISYLDSVAKP